MMTLSSSGSDPLMQLVAELSKLPGIGERSATRLAFFMLKQGPIYTHALSRALLNLSAQVKKCSQCHHFTAHDPCSICQDKRRERNLLCVVESVQSLMAIENTREYRGQYHVLHGLISPLEGVGPHDLTIQSLLERIQQQGYQEIIFALNSTIEGQATQMYIQRLLTPILAGCDVQLTRLAQGISLGVDLEYTDQASLARALVDRCIIARG